jgi:hypothetical protein
MQWSHTYTDGSPVTDDSIWWHLRNLTYCFRAKHVRVRNRERKEMKYYGKTERKANDTKGTREKNKKKSANRWIWIDIFHKWILQGYVHSNRELVIVDDRRVCCQIWCSAVHVSRLLPCVCHSKFKVQISFLTVLSWSYVTSFWSLVKLV